LGMASLRLAHTRSVNKVGRRMNLCCEGSRIANLPVPKSRLQSSGPQPLRGVRLFAMERCRQPVVDGHDHACAQHQRCVGGLLGGHRGRGVDVQVADRKAKAVDRQIDGIGTTKLSPDIPPGAVQERVAAIEEGPAGATAPQALPGPARDTG